MTSKAFIIQEDPSLYYHFHLDSETAESEQTFQTLGFENSTEYKFALLDPENSFRTGVYSNQVWSLHESMKVDDIISTTMRTRNLILSNRLCEVLKDENNLNISGFKYRQKGEFFEGNFSNVFISEDHSERINFKMSKLVNTKLSCKINAHSELRNQIKNGNNYLNTGSKPYILIETNSNIFTVTDVYSNYIFVTEKLKNKIESLHPIGLKCYETSNIEIKVIA